MAKQLYIIHKNGFAHDDIKIENMIYSIKKNEWFLIDFDISSPLNMDWGYRGTVGSYAGSGPSSIKRDFMQVKQMLQNSFQL